MGDSLGHQAQFAIDAAAPFDAGSYAFDPISESLRKETEILDFAGIRGTRSHSEERTRFGLNTVGGQITLEPSPADLDIFLDYMGFSEITDVWSLDETLTSFVLLFDRVADVFLYSSCYINTAEFSCEPGGKMQLVLDVWAISETEGQTFPGTVPALGVTALADEPYVFSDTSALTLVAADRSASCSRWRIRIDNALERRYTNSVNADSIISTDRIITLDCDLEWSSSAPNNTDLYNQALAGATGTLTVTNSTVSTSFAFATLQNEDRSPVVGGKGAIPYELSMTARQSGSTKELIITHDATA